MYGRQPATWICERFKEFGYEPEEVFPEDWGWCVMLQRDPFWLWIGCVNLIDHENWSPEGPPPAQDRLLWHAVPMASTPFFRYLFRAKPDLAPSLDKVRSQLSSILAVESQIQVLDEEVSDSWFDT